MAVEAANGLLKKRGITAADLDMVICATVTPDFVFPATANVLSDKIGAVNAWSYDINAACSGFLYALATGSQFIETGKYKKILVVGADKMSSIIDYTDRATCIIFGDGAGCIIFGDGAGAVLLEPNTDGFGVIDSVLKSDGAGRAYLHQKAGGSVKPASHETVDKKEHYVFQDGQPVFKAAVKNMADVSVEIMERRCFCGDNGAQQFDKR